MMRAITISTRTRRSLVACRHCKKTYGLGDKVVVHDFGKDAPWDVKQFSAHASCVQKVIDRFDDGDLRTPAAAQAAAAAEFRAITERIRSGGPVFLTDTQTACPKGSSA